MRPDSDAASVATGRRSEDIDIQPQKEAGAGGETIANEVYDTPIEQLDLSVRVFNSLKRTGHHQGGRDARDARTGEETMLAIRNFGEKSLDELKDPAAGQGFPVRLKMMKGCCHQGDRTA